MRVGKTVLTIALLLAATAFAPVPVARAAVGVVSSRPDPALPPTPRMVEIREALEESDRAISSLRARLLPTTSRAETLELKRQIARAKLEGEARMLRIQASWVRREGHEDQARFLEAEAVTLLAPRPRDAAAAARLGPAR
jgi:hypothetical protein